MIKKHEINLQGNCASPIKKKWELGHNFFRKRKLPLIEVHSEEED